MSKNYLFQALVITNWLLQLLLSIFPISSWYTAPWAEKLMALDGYGALLNWGNPIFYYLPLWGFLIASLGMLFFQNWARYLYLVFWIYGWVATLLFGFRVITPVQGFIGMAIGTIDGMVLYLAFLSALRHAFRRTQSTSEGERTNQTHST